MPTKFKDWKDLVDAATWAVLVFRKSNMFSNYEPTYNAMLGKPGHITDGNNYRKYQNIGCDLRFALNCGKVPIGFTRLSNSHHQWIYPLVDHVRYYDANCLYLGSIIDGAVTREPIPDLSPGVQQTLTRSTTQEISSMFHTHAVRTKAGWKAQVVYGDIDNNDVDHLPVVWESDATYSNDTEGEKKVTGESKAHEAASKAVDQALEALFAKVKV